MATIRFATVNSQVKKTIDFVLFCTLAFPNNSCPNFTAAINFSSNDIVAHEFPPEDLCATAPRPVSTKVAINPPWVIPAALR